MTDLTDKIALVTGASRGIGRAVAQAYARAGAHVILLASTQGALEEVYDSILAEGGQATILLMDLAKLRDITLIGHTIAERFGKLDILVCNAGITGPLTPVSDVNPKDWDKVMSVNFLSHAQIIRSVHALLLNSACGRVIFTTTSMADKAPAYWGLAASSKMALQMMALTYAAETQDTSIRVNLVRPGVVQTRLLDKCFPGGYPGKALQPDDVIGPYLECASDACSQHGQILDVLEQS